MKTRSNNVKANHSPAPTTPLHPQRNKDDDDNNHNDNTTITPSLLPLFHSHPLPLNTTLLLTCYNTQSKTTPHHHHSSSSHSHSPSHYQQHDNWSCGYRNAQILLSSILPHLPPHHPLFRICSKKSPPSLVELQNLMERSWRAGFDPEGKRYYDATIEGRAVHVGAVEVASLLTFCRVDATVVGFKALRPGVTGRLGSFVWNYFAEGWEEGGGGGSSSSCDVALRALRRGRRRRRPGGGAAPPPPLFLQWAGHSVTIVGVEKRRRGDGVSFHLLVFDPRKSWRESPYVQKWQTKETTTVGRRRQRCDGDDTDSRRRLSSLSCSSSASPWDELRWSFDDLFSQDYQIIVVSSTGIVSMKEREMLRRSVRVLDGDVYYG